MSSTAETKGGCHRDYAEESRPSSLTPNWLQATGIADQQKPAAHSIVAPLVGGRNPSAPLGRTTVATFRKAPCLCYAESIHQKGCQADHHLLVHTWYRRNLATT